MITKKIKELLKNPIYLGSLVMVLGSFIINIFNYLYHVIMGRMLGPTEYSVLAAVFSILYLVSVVPMSASISIVKFISIAKGKDELSHTYFSIKKFIRNFSLITCTVLILLSPAIASFMHIQNILLVFLISPFLYFSLMTLVNQSSSQGILKFNGNIAPSLIQSIGRLLFALFFVLLGFRVLGAISGVLLALIFSYLYSENFIKKYIKNIKASSKIKNFKIKSFLKYSIFSLIQAFSFNSLFTTDVILVKHFFPEHDAGIYASISTLGKIIFFISSPIASVMFPLVSKKHSLGEKFIRILFLSILMTILLSGFGVLCFLLFPDLIITLSFGKEFLLGSKYLYLMGIFIFFLSISYLLVNFSLSIGKTKVVFIPLISSILQILFIAIFSKTLESVLYASIIVSIIMSVFLFMYIIFKNK